MTAKTDTTIYKGHTRIYFAGFVAALLLLGVSTAMALNGTAGWEHSISRSINGWSAGWLTGMEWITLLGTPWMILVAVAGSFFARFYRLAWRLTLSVFAGYAGAFVMKHLVDRARPFEMFSDVHARVHETGMGFPSGHTTIATIIMLTFLPYLSTKWRLVIVPLVIVAVGFSRLYLGVHLPLDVIGGLALGAVIVASIRILPQPFRVFLRID